MRYIYSVYMPQVHAESGKPEMVRVKVEANKKATNYLKQHNAYINKPVVNTAEPTDRPQQRRQKIHQPRVDTQGYYDARPAAAYQKPQNNTSRMNGDYYNAICCGRDAEMSDQALEEFVKRFNPVNELVPREFIEGIIEKYIGLDPATGEPYRIRSLMRFVTAFMHKSYVDVCRENGIKGVQSFQRLEKVGDACLKAVISDLLYEKYPRATEALMTEVQAKMEFKKALVLYSRYWGLPQYFIIRAEEEDKGTRYNSVDRIEDIFESFIGALMKEFDAMGFPGLAMASILIKNFMEEFWGGNYLLACKLEYNYKGILMNYHQGSKKGVYSKHELAERPKEREWPNPTYYTVYEHGDKKKKVFCCVVYVPKIGNYIGRPGPLPFANHKCWEECSHLDSKDPNYICNVENYYTSIGMLGFSGIDREKKAAEKEAARQALLYLNVDLDEYKEK